MKRFVENEFSKSAKKRKDDDFLFQGNEADEALIAHLVDLEPAVIRQTEIFPNPPIPDYDQFSDEFLDDAAFQELQVQETEFLKQTQIMELSSQTSDPSRHLPCLSGSYDSNDRYKDDFEKVIGYNFALSVRFLLP